MAEENKNNPREMLQNESAKNEYVDGARTEKARVEDTRMEDTRVEGARIESARTEDAAGAHGSSSKQREKILENLPSTDSKNDKSTSTLTKAEDLTKATESAARSGEASTKPTKRDDGRRIKQPNEEKLKKERRKKRSRIIRWSVFIIVVLLIIGVLLAFWNFRWNMYDDAADIQGIWQISGDDTTLEITNDHLVLNDEIAYSYTLDPGAKTISFEFGALEGNARYRFSVDRQQLAIEDGEFDGNQTLSADIPWTIEAYAAHIQNKPEKSPAFDEGGMLLERVS